MPTGPVVLALALAADLAGYTPAAQWRGIYYRGEKIGFSVSQMTPDDDGYEMQEDGRLQMTLLGATTAVAPPQPRRSRQGLHAAALLVLPRPRHRAHGVHGHARDGTRLTLDVRTPSGARTRDARPAEPPALTLNLPRVLAARGLAPGQKATVSVFDPATMQQRADDDRDRLARGRARGGRPVPAFKVEMRSPASRRARGSPTSARSCGRRAPWA